MLDRRCPDWMVLTFILVVCCYLYLQNLGTPYITTWDEVVHANVIQNLAEHCCVPQLHRSSRLPTDYRVWMDNNVWLHKPLLPFYVTAAVYRVLGGSLFALRLGGALFSLSTALVLYFIGCRFFSNNVGLGGAAIFALMPYTNLLVKGLEFSGFPDLALDLLLSVALYLILDWTQTESIRSLRWLGVVLGLAYWCKGGLALAPFGVLAGAAVATSRVRSLVPALQSVGMFLTVVASERLYWMTHFPLEFRFEEKAQLAHIFEVVEMHDGPWYIYVVDFMPAMITPPLIFVAYFSIGWAVREWQPGKAQFTTALWVLAYLVPLSIGKSKIENFIFAVIPAVALLIPYVIEHLVESRRFNLLIALCVSSLSAYAVTRVVRAYDNPERFILPVTIVVFGVSFGIMFLTGFGSRWFTLALLTVTCLALFLSFVHRDNIANNRKRADSSAQELLRVTGSELRTVVETDALILLHSSMVELAYLHVMYWSGVDVLDVCLQRSATDTIARLRDRTKLYLVTNEVLPTVPIRRVPLGSLYSLKDIPFDEWAPFATVDCKAKLLPR